MIIPTRTMYMFYITTHLFLSSWEAVTSPFTCNTGVPLLHGWLLWDWTGIKPMKFHVSSMAGLGKRLLRRCFFHPWHVACGSGNRNGTAAATGAKIVLLVQKNSFYSLSIAFLGVHGMWNWKHSWSILRTRPHQKPQAPLSFVWGHWKTHSNQSKCKCIAILSDLMCPLVRCLGWWQFMTTGPWLF